MSFFNVKDKFRNEQEQIASLIRNAGDPESGRIMTYTGVDLAVQVHSSADETALVTIAIYPDDTRHILEIDAGRWDGPSIIDKLISAHDRFDSTLVVENNAAQDWILQFVQQKRAVPIIPFTTGRNKANPEFGIESLFSELAAGKWLIPNKNGRMDPQVDELVRELMLYSPKDHTGDRLMAMWFAREGARRSRRSEVAIGLGARVINSKSKRRIPRVRKSEHSWWKEYKES